MRWLKRFAQHGNAPVLKEFGAEIRPDTPFCAVGDIHGRLDLLEDALDLISCHCAGLPIVFVGDYVDRGPESAAVLRRLLDFQVSDPSLVICLMGNHEEMLQGFLDDPLRLCRVWLKNGGDQTLLSFNLPPLSETPTEKEVLQARDLLNDAMGPDLRTWLTALPVQWQSGNVWVTHAGADPVVDLDRQDRHALIWGHPEFRKTARTDGQWVVHGHTIVPDVSVQGGRISIDTGAYRTGNLSVVRIGDGKVETLTK